MALKRRNVSPIPVSDDAVWTDFKVIALYRRMTVSGMLAELVTVAVKEFRASKKEGGE